MAPVESEVYHSQTEEIIETVTVQKGKTEPVTPHEDALIGVFCDPEDKKGMLIVNTRCPESVGALLFEGKDDLYEDGKDIDINKPIIFSGGQYVIVYSINYPEEVYAQHFEDGQPITRKLITTTKKRIPVKAA